MNNFSQFSSNIIRNFISFIFILVILSFSNKFLDAFTSLKSFLLFHGISMLLIIFSIYIFSLKNVLFNFNRLDISLFIFLSYCFMTIIWSNSQILSINACFSLLFLYFFYYFIKISGPGTLYILKKQFLFLLIPAGIYGLLQYMKIDPFFLTPENYGMDRIFSTFGNKNQFAYFTGALIFPLLSSAIVNKNKTNVFSVISYFAIPLFFIMSCRGAIISFLILLPFYMLRIYRLRKKHYFFRLVSIFIILIFFYMSLTVTGNSVSLSERGKELFNNDRNVKMRLEIFRIAYEIFKENILTGTGINTFSINFGRKKNQLLLENRINRDFFIHVTRVHNEYLQILAETGLTGFIIFIYILCLIFIRLKNTRDEFFIFLYIIISSLFSFPLHSTGTILIFLYILLKATWTDQKSLNYVCNRFEITIISTGLIFLSILMIFSNCGNLLSSRFSRLGKINLQKGRIHESKKFFNMAVNTDHLNERAIFKSAVLELELDNGRGALNYLSMLNKRRYDPSIIYNKALAYLLIKNYRLSYNYLLNCIGKTRNDELVFLNLGVIMNHTGRLTQAAEYYLLSLKISKNKGALLNLLNLDSKEYGIRFVYEYARKNGMLDDPEIRYDIGKKAIAENDTFIYEKILYYSLDNNEDLFLKFLLENKKRDKYLSL